MRIISKREFNFRPLNFFLPIRDLIHLAQFLLKNKNSPNQNCIAWNEDFTSVQRPAALVRFFNAASINFKFKLEAVVQIILHAICGPCIAKRAAKVISRIYKWRACMVSFMAQLAVRVTLIYPAKVQDLGATLSVRAMITLHPIIAECPLCVGNVASHEVRLRILVVCVEAPMHQRAQDFLAVSSAKP